MAKDNGKRIMSEAEYRKRSVTVGLNAIECRAFIPPVGQQPKAPNVEIDPIAKAVAMEIFSKYPECLNGDGSLNEEGLRSNIRQRLIFLSNTFHFAFTKRMRLFSPARQRVF